MEKIIYGTDDCGSPIKVIIFEETLKRTKEVQKYLQEIEKKLDKKEYISCILNVGIKQEWNFSSHSNCVFIKVCPDFVDVCISGYECDESILDFHERDLFTISDVFFSDHFLMYCDKSYFEIREENMKKALKLLSKEHLEILKKQVKERKEKKND